VESTHAHGGEPEADDWGGPYDLVLLTRKMILAPESNLGERFASKAFQALRPGGAAVFWEVVHPDVGAAPISRAMEALYDLCASPSAPIRTESTYRAMLLGIGYKKVEVVPCLGGQTTFLVATR
jgi:hypothetical protein